MPHTFSTHLEVPASLHIYTHRQTDRQRSCRR